MKIKFISLCAIYILFAGQGYAKMADPTKPPKKSAPVATVNTQELKLYMIRIHENGKRAANINGVNVHKGDSFADHKVEYIGKDKIILRGPKEEKVELFMYKKPKSPVTSIDGDQIFPDVKTTSSEDVK